MDAGTKASSTAAVRSRHVFQFEPESYIVQQAMTEAAAALMPRLVHPNVLRTYGHSCAALEDVGDGCRCSFEVTLAQAHCNGGGLQQALRKGLFCRTMVREQWAVATALLRKIAQGMNFLHSRGICHGSLRPACILLHVRHPPPLTPPCSPFAVDCRCRCRGGTPESGVPKVHGARMTRARRLCTPARRAAVHERWALGSAVRNVAAVRPLRQSNALRGGGIHG